MLIKGNITKSDSSSNRTNRFPEPPIPLILPTLDKPSKDDMVEMVLKSVPSQDDSATYSITVRYFEDGTAAEWIHFVKDF